MTCWHSFPELKGKVLRSVWSSRLSMVLYGKGESGGYWSLQDPQFLGSWPVGEGKTEVLSLQFHWFPPCSDPLWPYRSGKRWITTSQADSNALLWQLFGRQPAHGAASGKGFWLHSAHRLSCYSLSFGRSFPGIHWKLAVFVFWAWLVPLTLTTTSSPCYRTGENFVLFMDEKHPLM